MARTDLPGFDDRPLEPFHVETDCSQSREKNDSLETNLLTLIVFRLRCPVKESDNIFRHLGGGGRGTYHRI